MVCQQWVYFVEVLYDVCVLYWGVQVMVDCCQQIGLFVIVWMYLGGVVVVVGVGGVDQCEVVFVWDGEYDVLIWLLEYIGVVVCEQVWYDQVVVLYQVQVDWCIQVGMFQQLVCLWFGGIDYVLCVYVLYIVVGVVQYCLLVVVVVDQLFVMCVYLDLGVVFVCIYCIEDY